MIYDSRLALKYFGLCVIAQRQAFESCVRRYGGTVVYVVGLLSYLTSFW